jgi:DNA-binding CsgD family transcriptional regulator
MSPAQIAAQAGGTVTERAIAILVASGVTGSKEIAAALGITMRAVQKARKKAAERTTVREPQDAEANHSSQNEPQDANHGSLSSPPPPKRKVSPCTPSKEIHPLPPQTLTSFESVSAEAAPTRGNPSAGKRYAFDGDTIRVLEPQFEKWRGAYPSIDVRAELLLADAYYTERPEKIPDGKWFFAVSRWLGKADVQAKADKRSELQKKIDRVCPPEIYAGLS